MIEHAPEASVTAEVVAAARMVESMRKAPFRLFSDPFAGRFLRTPRIRFSVFLARVLKRPDIFDRLLDGAFGVPGLAMSFYCRTRSIDDFLNGALRSGATRVVILGAGYDCRAYRIKGIERAKVLEVDKPTTQSYKRRRIESALGQAPPHVTFLPVDFEQTGIGEALKAGGFGPRERACVIWEGVTLYLHADAVDSTLRGIAATCSPGSELVFTYVHRGVFDGSVRFQGAAKLISAAERAGEPWRFGLHPDEVSTYLKDRGLTLIEDLGPEEHRARYLAPNHRKGAPAEFAHVVHARVAGDVNGGPRH